MKIAKLIDSYNYVVNEGRQDGIHLGDKVVIYLLGEEVKDPETGNSLGTLELPKEYCHVTHVQETMAIVRADSAPAKGSYLSTFAALKAMTDTIGDTSPYNFLSSKERQVVVGDLAKKVEKE